MSEQADVRLPDVRFGDGGEDADVTIGIGVPGSGGGSGGGGSSGGSKKEGPRTCVWLDLEVACTTDFGVWSEANQCWIQRLDPQPPFSDPRWQGNTTGAVYSCAKPRYDTIQIVQWLWFADPPVLVDPVVLAEEALEQMHLTSPQIRMTPLNDDAPVVVGVNTWLWLDDRGPAGFGPVTRSASAGGVTVTATARTTRIVWDLGDGTQMTCRNPGTPWTPALGTGPSPTCGHRYLTPSGPEGRRITATAHWEVAWSGAGQSGAISFTLEGSRQVEVTEVHALQTR